jgi:hypothetical protein
MFKNKNDVPEATRVKVFMRFSTRDRRVGCRFTEQKHEVRHDSYEFWTTDCKTCQFRGLWSLPSTFALGRNSSIWAAARAFLAAPFMLICYAPTFT